MDTRLRTSFIPKKTLILKSGDGGVSRVSINLFLSFGMIVFFLMIAVAGGAYLYKVVIQKKIVQEGLDLQKAENAFELPLITDVKRLDSRITVSKTILDNHTAALPIFDMLEALTLKTVRFTSFTYQYNGGGDVAGPTIALEGEARSYASVALLSESFAEDKAIKNPVFSGLDLSKEGGVIFSFGASLEPSKVSFKKYFETRQPAALP